MSESLKQALAYEMQQMQASVEDFDAAAAQALGVNRTDLRCIELLVAQATTTPGALGRGLGLSTGSVTAMLDRLQLLGYLVRTPDPADRRKMVVQVTDLARESAAALYGPLASEGAALLDPLDDKQLVQITRFLADCRKLYESHLARLRLDLKR